MLEDGPYLRADDRRTLALALALGPVLDETRAALGRGAGDGVGGDTLGGRTLGEVAARVKSLPKAPWRW